MTTALFSSNESSYSDRQINTELDQLTIAQIWPDHQLPRCLQWIRENKFHEICLQFSDNLLNFSAKISADIKRSIDGNVYVLGDTSYGSCCVDEIASAHVKGDCVIHFGNACLSKVVRLPVLYVFPELPLDINRLQESIIGCFSPEVKSVVIFYDCGYFYLADTLRQNLEHYDQVEIAKLAIDSDMIPNILCWCTEQKKFKDSTCIFIGTDGQRFTNLTMTIEASEWHLLDPSSHNNIAKKTIQNSTWLRRRYYYIEKCKDADSFGILVGTLTSNHYLDMVKHIQTLCRKNGKRSYIISVGKLNPAKLANFADIDCFVLIGCPENIIDNPKEFFKPVVSVFEFEMAMHPAWKEQIVSTYCSDFKEFLSNGKFYRKLSTEHQAIENDETMSLVTGRMRSSNVCAAENSIDPATNVVSEKTKNFLMETSSAKQLLDRSWQGLDPSLGKHKPTIVTEGRSGIPLEYKENTT